MSFLRKITGLLLLLAGVQSGAMAQKFQEHPVAAEPRNVGNAVLINLQFGVHWPGADLADRFGRDADFGGGVEFITANNFLVGAESQFFFGSTVKEDPLAILRTPEGDIIGNDQFLATVSLKERGFYVGGYLGKMVRFSQKRSGLRITLGGGVLRHKIRLQDDSQSVGAITGDYAKGYDRLTAGPTLSECIGWQHLGANRRANWYIGLEFKQGFTKSLRDWDFTEMRKLDGTRTDLRFGIRAAWTIPFYVGNASKIYY